MTVAEWVPVARTSEVPDGAGHRVEVHDVPIAVWNVNGDFYATSDICSHEEAYLSEGMLWDEVVECPLHGAQFDVRTGQVLSLPAIFPIASYPVKVEDGTIFVGWTGE